MDGRGTVGIESHVQKSAPDVAVPSHSSPQSESQSMKNQAELRPLLIRSLSWFQMPGSGQEESTAKLRSRPNSSNSRNGCSDSQSPSTTAEGGLLYSCQIVVRHVQAAVHPVVLRKYLRLAIPGAFSLCFEAGSCEITTIMAGEEESGK